MGCLLRQLFLFIWSLLLSAIRHSVSWLLMRIIAGARYTQNKVIGPGRTPYVLSCKKQCRFKLICNARERRRHLWFCLSYWSTLNLRFIDSDKSLWDSVNFCETAWINHVHANQTCRLQSLVFLSWMFFHCNVDIGIGSECILSVLVYNLLPDDESLIHCSH